MLNTCTTSPRPGLFRIGTQTHNKEGGIRLYEQRYTNKRREAGFSSDGEAVKVSGCAGSGEGCDVIEG